MLSRKARELRKTLEKDRLDPTTSIVDKRAAWDEYAKTLPIPEDIAVEDEMISGVSARWYRPPTGQKEGVIVYMHGGGLTEGSVYTAQQLTAHLAQTAQMSVLSVDYPLAPEHPYPAALEAMLAVYRALLERGLQPAQIAFGADSSGCNLALATLIALRDQASPLPGAAFLISPSVDLTFTGESMVSRAALDPMVSPEVLRDCAKLYAQEVDLSLPAVSPLFADLSDLPPFLIQAGDHEILLSDAIRLHARVEASGGISALKIWPEMWHVWHYFVEMPEAEQGIEEIGRFLAGYLTSRP